MAAVWLRHPSALYLQAVPMSLLVVWYVLRRRSSVREYRALKARRDAHRRELQDILDRHA